MFHISKVNGSIGHINYYENSTIHYIILFITFIKNINYNYLSMIKIKGSDQSHTQKGILLHYVCNVCPGSNKINKTATVQPQR